MEATILTKMLKPHWAWRRPSLATARPSLSVFGCVVACCSVCLGISGCSKSENKAPEAHTARAVESAPTPKQASPKPRTLSSASAHLPLGCDPVIRLDVTGMLRHSTVKQRLTPFLNNPAELNEQAKELAATLKASGVKLEKDLHEVAACILPAASKTQKEPDFIVIAGGSLPQGTIVPAALKHKTRTLKLESFKVSGHPALRVKPEGNVLTQADDGAVVFASTEALAAQALKASTHFKSYNIPKEPELAAVTLKYGIERLRHLAPGSPIESLLRNVERLALTFSVSPGAFGLQLFGTTEKNAAELQKAIEQFKTMLSQRQGQGPVPTRALKDLKLERSGKEVSIELPLSKEDLDSWLQSALSSRRTQNGFSTP